MAGSNMVTSLIRALDILDLACNNAYGISVDALEQWGIRRSSSWNILRTLVYKGFLTKTGGRPRWYRPGPALAALYRSNRDRDLLLKAGPVVMSISRQFGATAIFSEHIGGAGLALLRAVPHRPGIVDVPAGHYLRPYGMGLVYQAFLGKEDVEAFRKRHPFTEWGKPHWKSLKQVDRYLAKARKKGYIVVGNKRRVGVFRVAAPIFGPGKSMLGAIGLYKPASQTTPQEQQQCIEAVCQAAEELSYKPGVPGISAPSPMPSQAVSRG